MEKLLNKLLERGRKPRGLDRIKGGIIYCGPKGGITFQHKGKVFDFCGADYVLYNGEEYMNYDSYITYLDDDIIVDTNHIFGYRKLLRELCSKESLLWQFVCENKLQPTNRSGSWEYSDGYTGWTCMAYQFRLIESALKDESELDEFLLSNIKVDG